jgi:hypothetical protein
VEASDRALFNAELLQDAILVDSLLDECGFGNGPWSIKRDELTNPKKCRNLFHSKANVLKRFSSFANLVPPAWYGRSEPTSRLPKWDRVVYFAGHGRGVDGGWVVPPVGTLIPDTEDDMDALPLTSVITLDDVWNMIKVTRWSKHLPLLLLLDHCNAGKWVQRLRYLVNVKFENIHEVPIAIVAAAGDGSELQGGEQGARAHGLQFTQWLTGQRSFVTSKQYISAYCTSYSVRV